MSHSFHCKIFFPFFFFFLFFFAAVYSVHQASGLRLLRLLIVEFAQESLDLLVVLLDINQGILDILQRRLLFGFVRRSGLVLAGAVVLDFLTCLLHLVQAQCRR